MAEHQCKLTIFPEGEAVCLECGALYIFSGHMVHEDLLDCRRENPDRCDCGHSVQHEHDQHGCAYVSCRYVCKTKGACAYVSCRYVCKTKGAYVVPSGVDPWYSCGAGYCDDPACTTHNINHPNHDG